MSILKLGYTISSLNLAAPFKDLLKVFTLSSLILINIKHDLSIFDASGLEISTSFL